MSYGIGKQPQQQGGKIKGKGTGTSDDIKKTVDSGSYIMPKDSTDAIGEENLARLGQPTDVNLSNGEYQLTPDQVHAVGAQTLDQMKNQTHTPVDQPQVGFGIGQGGEAKPELFFANGGLVSPYPSADDIRKARTGKNVPSTAHAQDFIGKQVTPQQGGLPQTRGQTYDGQARNVTPARGLSAPTQAPGLPAPPQSGGFLSKAGNMAKGLGKFHGAMSMVSGAIDGLNTSTNDYATRLGLDPNADRGVLKDTAIRTAGVLSDVGNAASFGLLGKRFADKQVSAAQTQADADAADLQARVRARDAQANKPQATGATGATQSNGERLAIPQEQITQRMNDAMYGQSPTAQQAAQAGTNNPYQIQQNGNSFSYANPGAAAQARAQGIPENQPTGIRVQDPRGGASILANTREFGASQEQIDRALSQSLNGGQGFGIRYPDRPTRNDAQEAERKNVLAQIQAPIKGARGMTSSQRSQLMEMQTGEDQRAMQMYNTDAGNATSQFNNTANNNASIAQTAMREQGANDRAVLGENGQTNRLGMNLEQDAAKFNADYGLRNREMNLTETKEGFGIRNAQRAEKLAEMYDKAETDEQRQSIQERMNRLTGKAQGGLSGKDRYMTVGGGQEWNEQAGAMVNRPQQIFDTQSGRLLNMDGSPAGVNQMSNNEFDTSKMKDGQVYRAPDGTHYRWDAKAGQAIPVQE